MLFIYTFLPLVFILYEITKLLYLHPRFFVERLISFAHGRHTNSRKPETDDMKFNANIEKGAITMIGMFFVAVFTCVGGYSEEFAAAITLSWVMSTIGDRFQVGWCVDGCKF